MKKKYQTFFFQEELDEFSSPTEMFIVQLQMTVLQSAFVRHHNN